MFHKNENVFLFFRTTVQSDLYLVARGGKPT